LSQATLNSASRVSINVYWLVTGLFGLAYGIYGYYVFVYLSRLHPDAASIIQPLLPVLAATMMFEFIAEPITGRFADIYGRRLAVIMAFILISDEFIAYSLAAIPAVAASQWRVQITAIGAELVLAIGLALHSGSFDAWVIERIHDSEGSRDIPTESIFARAAQIFTVGLTLGGFIGSFAVSQTNSERDLFANIWPWILSAFLALLAVLVGAAAMFDRPNVRAPNWTEGTTLSAFLKDAVYRVTQLRFQSAAVRQTIYVNSAMYSIGIVYIYFSTLIAERALRNFGLIHILYLVPFLYLVPRLLGPQLAILFSKGRRHTDSNAYRLMFRAAGLGCGVSAAALAFSASKLASPQPLPDNAKLIFLFGCIAFFGTSLFVHMLKPIATAYLNFHIADDNERAFINSMSTPAGGFVVALVCFALLIVNGSSAKPNADDILMIFLIPAILATITVWFATRDPRKNRA
jgi:MFS family permease